MKRTVFIFTGRFIQAILSIVLLRLATNFLNHEELGKFYVLVSITTFFGFMVVNPVGQYCARRILSWSSRDHEKKLIIILLLILFLLGSIGFGLTLTVQKFFGIVKSLDKFSVFLATFIGIIFSSSNTLIVPLLNILNKTFSFIILNAATVLLTIVLSCIFAIYYSPTATSWLSGQLIAQFLMALAAIYILTRKKESDTVKAYSHQTSISYTKIRNAIKFILPLSGATISMWLLSESYKIIAEKSLGTEFVATIGVGLTISTSILAVAESLFTQIYQPIFYQEIEGATFQERERAWNKMINLALPAFLLTSIFVSAFSPYIVSLLASAEYHESFIFIIFGTWINTLRILSNLYINVGLSEMKTGGTVVPYAVGAILAVILMICSSLLDHAEVLIPISLILANLVTFILLKMRMGKLLKTKIDIKRILVFMVNIIPFLLVSILFYKYSFNQLYSFVILLISGLYYCCILWISIRPNLANTLNLDIKSGRKTL